MEQRVLMKKNGTKRSTSEYHPSTTNTSKEYPSVVENTCASRIFSPISESKADS